MYGSSNFGGTSAVTSIANATTAFTILSANSSRRAFFLANTSTLGATVYVGLGFTPTTALYTFSISGTSFIAPTPITFTGAVYGIASSANGNTIVTEITN